MRVPLHELSRFAADFVARLPKESGTAAYIVGLSGELGAGKTAFVQKVAEALGVTGSVRSPTFTIAQAYPINRPPFSRLIHIDAYRLSSGETDTFGWDELTADPKNVVLVEWFERLPKEWTKNIPALRFNVTGEDEREIIEYGG